jgi:hypothetical protein
MFERFAHSPAFVRNEPTASECLSEKPRCLYHVIIEGAISILMEALP